MAGAARVKHQGKTTASGPARKTERTSAAHEPGGRARSIAPPLSSLLFQAKLQIGGTHDPHELEADRVAERVMRQPELGGGGAVVEGPSHPPRIQRARATVASVKAPEAPPGVQKGIQSLRGGGEPLSPGARAFMEPRFGYDFRGVRVHSGSHPAALARSVGARAFAVGRDIVFGQGQGAATTSAGRRLLAHELTHVIQQGGAAPLPAGRRGGHSSGSGAHGARVRGRSAGPVVQRDVVSDIRAESAKPEQSRNEGRLGHLETRARTQADFQFQQDIHAPPLQRGATGRATQIVNHISRQLIRLEGARQDGYQQAVSSTLGSLTLSGHQARSFWMAFAGNTLWALSGLVPLLGPVVGVGEIAVAAGGGVDLYMNLIQRFLKSGGGSVASAVVGLAGAELAQFSGGVPVSTGTLPSTMQQVQTTFTRVNARLMSRYRSEAFALTLEFLRRFGHWVMPTNTNPISADFLESFATGCIMETLLADLQREHILDTSNYTIDRARAQAAAERDLQNAITDVWFTNQITSVGPGARAGVLQIKLGGRYPNRGSTFQIEGGNIVGGGSDIDLLRQNLAGRHLEDITIPKVIEMKRGRMGGGWVDCDWAITVSGEHPQSPYPTIQAIPPGGLPSRYQYYTAVPQHVQRISQYSRWGFSWLAAYHLRREDLDNDDRRNNRANQWAGAREVWQQVKGRTPGSVGHSSW